MTDKTSAGSSNECGCQLEVYGQRHSRECLEHEITRLRRALADEQAAHKGTAALARAAPETLSDDPFLADRANGVHGIYCIARVINGTTEYWTGQEWAAFCNDLYFDLRPAQKASEEPPVLGSGAGPAPMPTVDDAIAAHVREIQILCDASGRDPTQWLNDEAAGGCL